MGIKLVAQEVSERPILIKREKETSWTSGYLRKETREFDLDIVLDEYECYIPEYNDRFKLDGKEWRVIKIIREE